MSKNLVTGTIAAALLFALPAAVGLAEDAKKPQATAETFTDAPRKRFVGFEKGMGIGGWLTNYKRFNVLPEQWRGPLSPGDFEHFDTYITQDDVRNIVSFGLPG